MSRAVDRHTPTLSVSDSRGLPVRQITYLRSVAGETAIALISRQQFDPAARLVAQRDPRLPRPNQVLVSALGGTPLKVDSVDAGMRLTLPGLAGEVLERWDGRGNHWRMTYDDLLRVTAIEVNAQPETETFTFATASADAGRNLRGNLLALQDRSGGVNIDTYSLLGQALAETRTFADGKTFTSRRIHGPLGSVLEQVDASGHRQRSYFDLAGQLRQVQLKIDDQTAWATVLEHARYNAAGQIILQQAGNGVISHWAYDPANNNLHRQTTQKSGQPLLQDFEHQYDPVGNLVRTLDHAYTPSHFANQRVDGHREFSYDSLYRLKRATGYDDGPPSDTPGLPQPTDPADRRNYIQMYTYDDGGNLIELRHLRESASHTRTVLIDPASNRGVRWKSGDPVPDFNQLFDRNGNLTHLQPGQDLQWNANDELETAILVRRENGVDDAEYYRYSQGLRVHKRLETATGHFQDVRYLPGLEIRTRDNGEELHVITLAIGVGSVRCLYWATGKPRGIATTQMRYSVEDHLGSNLMELDQQAQLISHEGYYPFGATAWMAASSAVDADYKTVRYSGKEMDVSGLYYYGARYYAAWLQRWISADPAGAVDGLNLYGFVANNPLRYVDPAGGSKAESVIFLYSGFITAVNEHAERTLVQIHNVIHQENITQNLMMNLAGETIGGVIGYEGGVLGSTQTGLVFPSAPHALQFTDPNALVGGNIGGDAAGAMGAPLTDSFGFTGALIPQTSKMSVAAIDSQLGVPDPVGKTPQSWREIKDEFIHPALNSVLNPEFIMNRVMSSWLSIIPGALNMFQRAIEAEDIKNRLDPVKINKIDTVLAEWTSAIESRWAQAEKAFNALASDVIYPADLLPNVNHMTPRELTAPIHRSALKQQTRNTLESISRMQQGMAWYKEMGSTDNQYLLKQARHSRPKAA